MKRRLAVAAIALAFAGCGGGSTPPAHLTSNLAWTASFGSGNAATPLAFPAAGETATVTLIEGCTGGSGVTNCPAFQADPIFTLVAPGSCTSFAIDLGLPVPVDPPATYTVTALRPSSCVLTATPVDSRFPPVQLTVSLAAAR